jgi:hypothetical protein
MLVHQHGRRRSQLLHHSGDGQGGELLVREHQQLSQRKPGALFVSAPGI